MSHSGEASELIGHLVGRIESFSPEEVAPLAENITGELAELATWWLQRVPVDKTRLVNSIIDTADCAGIELGVVTTDKAIDSGATLITLVSHNNVTSTNVRAIIGLLTHKDAHAVYHQSPATTDAQAMADMADIRDSMRRHLENRANPLALAQLDPSVEFTVGLLLNASARRTPVILGTLSHLAAALIAQRIAMPAWNWWRYGSTSPDTGVQLAIDRIGLPAGLALNLSDDSGMGARISAQLIEELVPASI